MLAAARKECDDAAAAKKRKPEAVDDVAIVHSLSAEEARAKRKIADIHLDDEDDEEAETVKVGGSQNMEQSGRGAKSGNCNTKGKGRGWYQDKKKW